MDGEKQSSDNVSASAKRTVDKKAASKSKMTALLGSITAHTNNMAVKNEESSSPRTENSGVMFIDNTSAEPEKDELVYLDPSLCYAEEQVREGIKESDIIERRHSIAAQGQIKPITVNPRDERGYKVTTGEVRWRACLIEPKLKVMAIIKRTDKDIPEDKYILKQLAENTEAVPLTIYEIAKSLQRAMIAGNYESQTDLAKAMGWHDEKREDYGRNKVSQYLAIFNLDERGQKLYQDGKMADIRAIKILSAIRTASEASYSAMISMIESGGTVTRKMLEKERDSLQNKADETEKNKSLFGGAGASGSELNENQKANTAASTKSGVKEKVDPESMLPRIIFDYQRMQVELVYKKAPNGKVLCKVIGDPNEQVLELDRDDIVFNHFVIPK